jgi:dihydrofolate reductase
MNSKLVKVSAIVAVGKNNEMGVGNDKLPWEIPEDAKYYRDKTRYHVNVMGRTTYESLCDFFHGIPSNRINIVITRDPNYDPNEYPRQYDGYRKSNPLKNVKFEGKAYAFTDAKKAIDFGKEKEIEFRGKLDDELDPEVLVVGGSQIFSLCKPFTDRVYLTQIDAEFPKADVFFPDYVEFNKIVSERKSSDSNYSYTFKVLERK